MYDTCPCYTDLAVSKKSYGGCDKYVCGKTPYLKPVGEFTKNFDLKCSEIFNPTGLDTFLFDPSRFKLKPNVPTGQLVTFLVDVKFSGSALFGGNHFDNVPIYANAQYGFSNPDNIDFFTANSNLGQAVAMQLAYNPWVSGTVGSMTSGGGGGGGVIIDQSISLLSKQGASLFVKKGTQIFAGVAQ
jgi:hypothetical protein